MHLTVLIVFSQLVDSCLFFFFFLLLRICLGFLSFAYYVCVVRRPPSTPTMCCHIQLPVWQSYLAAGQMSYSDVVGSEAALFNVYSLAIAAHIIAIYVLCYKIRRYILTLTEGSAERLFTQPSCSCFFKHKATYLWFLLVHIFSGIWVEIWKKSWRNHSCNCTESQTEFCWSMSL